MFEDVMRQMRQSLRQRTQIVSKHAQEQMAWRGISFYDVERAVLSGRIHATQYDRIAREVKYLVIGEAYRFSYIEVVAKLTKTNRLFIITAYIV